MTHLSIGDRAPNFSGKTEKGELISNHLLANKKYILFFYPKDDTPGCTKEACSVRDHYNKINARDYQVFGVSPDTEKKHQKFIDKYEFQYALISDTTKEIIKAFGVWGPKKFMGRELIGIHRTTFIINENGIITDIIKKVVTKDHGQQILESIKIIESTFA